MRGEASALSNEGLATNRLESLLAKDIAEVRHEIARLARDKKKRFVRHSPSSPCVWQPLTVINPETDLPFTAERAWKYIAELAEMGHPMDEVVLRKPPGEVAYEMKVELATNVPPLYIKFQIKGGNIHGRSFHYSSQ